MKKMEKSVTFLGKDTKWEGKLTFNGSVRIDGYFKGEISSDGNLVVGEEGMIEADIHVSQIVNSGEIHGNITSDQRVDIHAPGKVFGSIQAPVVVIDKGVIFEGTTKMYRAKNSDKQPVDVTPLMEQDGGPPPNLTAIYGVIKDRLTGRPIKNARVRCKGTDQEVINTNASGYYEMTNLKDGKWKLKIEARGYKKGAAKVTISGGGTHEQNCELEPTFK
ncbi:MAG: polymer-forming cytoskeletal protein [Deltaproteobacteria bacterium]|nr:polymer-forming cytoskeletal protein [Deltaproteobacteria bacterium]